MDNHEATISNLIQELKRGSYVLMVLSQLSEQQYGYSLIQRLADKGVNMEPGTLYPLLRRLEKQGLLVSKWDVEAGRPRRYYLISLFGSHILSVMANEWGLLDQQVRKLLSENEQIIDK